MSGTAANRRFRTPPAATPFRSQPGESPEAGNQRSDFRVQSDVLHDSVCLPQMIPSLLRPVLTARAQPLDFAGAQRSIGAEDPGVLLVTLLQTAPWLAARRSALATGRPRSSPIW